MESRKRNVYRDGATLHLLASDQAKFNEYTHESWNYTSNELDNGNGLENRRDGAERRVALFAR